MNKDAADIELTPKEAAFLVLLMVEAGDVLNSDMPKKWGFGLDKKSRIKLNKLGYVASVPEHRTFVHRLSDAGWARCYEPLNLESPKARAQGAALASLMGAVLANLKRTESALADFMVGDLDADKAPTDLSDRIRSVYEELAVEPGGWVGLIQIRAALNDVERDDLDEALCRLERSRGVNIVPESNQNALSEDERASALWIGGQYKHFLSIGNR